MDTSVPMPLHFINPDEDERNPEEDEQAEETLTDSKFVEYTIKVPPPLVQKPQAPSQKSYEMPKGILFTPISLILQGCTRKNNKTKMKYKFISFGKSLLSNKEKLLELANTPLNENCSAVILKKLNEKLRDPEKFLIPCSLSLSELISTQMTLELANRSVCTPAGIARDVFVPVGRFTFPADFVIVDYESDPRVPLILGIPFLRTARALIDVHGEELILHDGDERLILNMKHGTSSYSNKHQRESINMIDIYNISYKDYLEDLFANEKITNHLSGNPTFSSKPDTLTSDLTSPEEEFETYLASDSFPPGNSNPSSPLLPFHNSLSGSTTSSSPSLSISETSDYSLEGFADELAHITFPLGNDDLPFDAESDLRGIEYLLNNDPIEEMDSILEDSVDKNSRDNNLDDTISKMFTDEHALDYSSPPLWDDYDDELFDLESVNDNTYDDPFDFKEEKIKESKLLIDELDLPESSNFLPFPECDLVFYEDFSEVDALSSFQHDMTRLGCAETKVSTWNDLAFKLIILGWILIHRMKEPEEMNEVVEKISCNFPLHFLALVATDAILSLELDKTQEVLKQNAMMVLRQNAGAKRNDQRQNARAKRNDQRQNARAKRNDQRQNARAKRNDQRQNAMIRGKTQ
ncbi:reverse transcriptase domain-containing protein [Tanacetum coccineum]|uniref:Reverse transcriptase domain-containing protein n=1 Tax=Tanacetum coccineum TaxID=301880 RepID=A0ABQ4WEU0_9ASTR